MNRRSFIAGLLASAALPAARTLSMEYINDEMLWGRAPYMTGLQQCITHTMMYGNPDWEPTRFTGFVPFRNVTAAEALEEFPAA